jgi:hypothetical protein
MNQAEDQILGYTQKPDGSWEPILPAQRGYIYTQAFILCRECQAAIRPQGGPNRNALCLTCYEHTAK